VLSPKRSSSFVDCAVPLTSFGDSIPSRGGPVTGSTSKGVNSTGVTESASTTGTVSDSAAGASGFVSARAEDPRV
jgi:hypothetical protein